MGGEASRLISRRHEAPKSPAMYSAAARLLTAPNLERLLSTQQLRQHQSSC
jgi:hypothetical protein